jgi:hypothetical protein
LAHFEFVVNTGAVGDHTLGLVDVSGQGFTGYAVDSVRINDWI